MKVMVVTYRIFCHIKHLNTNKDADRDHLPHSKAANQTKKNMEDT